MLCTGRLGSLARPDRCCHLPAPCRSSSHRLLLVLVLLSSSIVAAAAAPTASAALTVSLRAREKEHLRPSALSPSSRNDRDGKTKPKAALDHRLCAKKRFSHL